MKYNAQGCIQSTMINSDIYSQQRKKISNHTRKVGLLRLMIRVDKFSKPIVFQRIENCISVLFTIKVRVKAIREQLKLDFLAVGMQVCVSGSIVLWHAGVGHFYGNECDTNTFGIRRLAKFGRGLMWPCKVIGTIKTFTSPSVGIAPG